MSEDGEEGHGEAVEGRDTQETKFRGGEGHQDEEREVLWGQGSEDMTHLCCTRLKSAAKR